MSIFEDKTILIICCLYSAVIGAVLGSFLNCAAGRIAAGKSFLKGRSHCMNPDCGHVLSALDLIPVFSWIFLKGKCRYCRSRVSVRYPLTELMFAVLSVLCLLRCDLSVEYLRNMILFSCLFCLSLVDLECLEIPNGCLILSVIAWMITAPFVYSGWKIIGLQIMSGIIYCVLFLLFSICMDRILKKESLGGGDIKLFGVMGLYLGFIGSLFAIWISCLLGLAIGLIRRKKGNPQMGQIPLGPAIAGATFLVLLYGHYAVDWYMGLLY